MSVLTQGYFEHTVPLNCARTVRLFMFLELLFCFKAESYYIYPGMSLNLQQLFCLSFPNTRVISMHSHTYFYEIVSGH